MRADRLLSILLLLQTRTQVTAAELAARLEVSVRTVYRDVEALSAAGVPVWAERGRAGGIRLLPGYRTDVTGLTGDEARALFVLATAGTHEALGLGAAIGSALRKVMAALPAPHRPEAERVSERILVDPTRWTRASRAAAPAAPDLDQLRHAVFADQRLTLTYRHSDADEPVEHTIDPYGLVSKAGVWYLVADLAGEPRLYRADRTLAVALDDEPARRRPDASLADVWAELRERVERPGDDVLVTARVRRRRWEMFLRLHGERLVGTPVNRGAWTEVRLGLRALREVRTLLPLGAEVEVLTPPRARAELASAAAEVAALYAREHPASPDEPVPADTRGQS